MRGFWMNRCTLLAAGLAILGVAHAADPGDTQYELTLVDMQGQKKVLGTLPGSVFAPRVSPDGTRVAFELNEPPGELGLPVTRIHVADINDPGKRKGMQLALTTPRTLAPIWNPEGDWLAFVAMGNGPDGLFRQRADGWIQPIFMTDGRAAEGWYENGRLLFLTLKGDKDYGIAELDVNTRKVTPLVDQPGSAQHSSEISPDGNWIAYASDETGRQEIWLEPLPGNGRRIQLTRNGGRHPQWSPDGKALYFDQGGQMYRLDLAPGAEAPRAGEPVSLPIRGFQQGDLRRQYDLMPDGKGFVMLFPKGG